MTRSSTKYPSCSAGPPLASCGVSPAELGVFTVLVSTGSDYKEYQLEVLYSNVEHDADHKYRQNDHWDARFAFLHESR